MTRRWTVAAFLVVAGVGVTLSALIASGPPLLDARWRVLGKLGLWALAWLVGVATALRLPTRVSLALVLGAGLALRLAALAGPPVTSDDLYRYAWDARVQESGVNPYRHPPEAAELAHLRDPWLWPNGAGCAALDRPPGCTRINRPAVPTIYPPLAQSWFVAVDRLGPADGRHTTWQVAGLATEVAVVALLVLALHRWGGDRRWTALYALCPAPVLEIVQNGHVDGFAIALVVASLVVVAPAREGPRRPPGWRQLLTGALVGAAAAVKLYATVILFAMVGAASARRLPLLVRAGAGALVVATLSYLPHVLDAGGRVLGYLPGYLQEEDYSDGSRFLLPTAFGLPSPVAAGLSVAAVAGVVIWVLVRRPRPAAGACALLGTLLLATSPVQPWYAVTLLAVATVAVQPWWAAVVIAGYPYYLAVILDHPHAVALGRLAYGGAALVVVTGTVLSARQRPDGRDPDAAATLAPGDHRHRLPPARLS